MLSGCEEFVVSSEEASIQNYFTYHMGGACVLSPWSYILSLTPLKSGNDYEM